MSIGILDYADNRIFYPRKEDISISRKEDIIISGLHNLLCQ